MTYQDHICIICDKDYQIYGSNGFCDDCMIEGDDELQGMIKDWAESMREQYNESLK